jgi:hypothetical protein
LRFIPALAPRAAAENHFVGASRQCAIHPTRIRTKKQSCKDHMCVLFALVLANPDHTLAIL